MKTVEEKKEFREKIEHGLESVRKKLIEFKKQKKSVPVIMKDGKIVKEKPE